MVIYSVQFRQSILDGNVQSTFVKKQLHVKSAMIFIKNTDLKRH